MGTSRASNPVQRMKKPWLIHPTEGLLKKFMRFVKSGIHHLPFLEFLPYCVWQASKQELTLISIMEHQACLGEHWGSIYMLIL